MPPRVSNQELASIIVPCCNQASFTRLCLESLWRSTRYPYELLLIDNGSTDDTAAFFEEILTRPAGNGGPVRVEVISNSSNRGYAAACNQGIKCAQGRHLVFLNNDVVVSDGWLSQLVKAVRHQWPTIGMAGPVTNWTAPPQQITVDYRHLADMPAFAARRRQEFSGKGMFVERLTGFCLLIRRDVLDQIGTFDPRFGLGFFEDDDLCARARQAGFKLLVALDVFVHHFGNRTFLGLGLNRRHLLNQNFLLFKEKWPERAKWYRQSAALRPKKISIAQELSSHNAAPRVSLCMIVRNEESNLADCLTTIADLVDEISILDTGSTDRTREIAASFGARVHDLPWAKHFAAARNEGMRHATGDYILWLDADERLCPQSRAKLVQLFATLRNEPSAYVMRQLSKAADALASETAVDQVRLFRRDPMIRWEYRVHEQVLLAIRRAGHLVRWTDIVIDHLGFEDPALRSQKLARNMELMHLDLAERPDDPIPLFNLGCAYQQVGRLQQSVHFLQQSLAHSPEDLSIQPKLYGRLSRAYELLNQPDTALSMCREGLRRYPADVELLFLEGILLRGRGELDAAAASFQRLLQLPERQAFGSFDTRLRTYKTQHALAEVYLQQGHRQHAKHLWTTILTHCPDFSPAHRALQSLADPAYQPPRPPVPVDPIPSAD